MIDQILWLSLIIISSIDNRIIYDFIRFKLHQLQRFGQFIKHKCHQGYQLCDKRSPVCSPCQTATPSVSCCMQYTCSEHSWYTHWPGHHSHSLHSNILTCAWFWLANALLTVVFLIFTTGGERSTISYPIIYWWSGQSSISPVRMLVIY